VTRLRGVLVIKRDEIEVGLVANREEPSSGVPAQPAPFSPLTAFAFRPEQIGIIVKKME
jgi:hypothetical protein